MRHPSAPGNGTTPRTRGAIRTHLGRKRTGPRSRMGGSTASFEPVDQPQARADGDADLFDRLFGQVQSLLGAAGEQTASALESALDMACRTLVSAGEFTAENAQRLRRCIKQDLMHRDDPALRFHTGDITSAGTLTCENCGWTLQSSKATLLPACPQCADTSFRKTA